jgi:hypothetical protein
MLLQQTSKYLMKVIGKKNKTLILDLGFMHERPTVNFEAIEGDLRNITHLEIMLQDLFRMKYHQAVAKTQELARLYQDKEQADLHFHAQAGNALALTFGTCNLT